VNKTAARAAQFAKRILLHAYSRTTASFQLREQTKASYSFLINWHNSIFGNKLRTIEDKNPRKVKNNEPQLRIYWFLQKKQGYKLCRLFCQSLGKR